MTLSEKNSSKHLINQLRFFFDVNNEERQYNEIGVMDDPAYHFFLISGVKTNITFEFHCIKLLWVKNLNTMECVGS